MRSVNPLIQIWAFCLGALALSACSAQGQGPVAAAPAKPSATAADAVRTPSAAVDSTPKGKLKNPYSDDNAPIVAAGKAFYFHSGCNGCHGGGGGGGICPPLINDIWVYGGDDDTLFRLVTLGSDALQAKGYTRVGLEKVVAPMPPMGAIVPTEDALWKIITFIRSSYHGSPAAKFGSPPDAPPPPG